MQFTQKATLGLALIAGLAVGAVRPAAASHEQFQNVSANGTSLTPTVDVFNAVNNITLVGNVLTISTDYHSNQGEFPTDFLNYTFFQTGGTSLTPAGVSPAILFTPVTQTLTESFTFTGTFQGSLNMITNFSSPDYSSPANGYHSDGATFNLNLTPGGSAVPEPSSIAFLGMGGAGLMGLMLRSRKRSA